MKFNYVINFASSEELSRFFHQSDNLYWTTSKWCRASSINGKIESFRCEYFAKNKITNANMEFAVSDECRFGNAFDGTLEWKFCLLRRKKWDKKRCVRQVNEILLKSKLKQNKVREWFKREKEKKICRNLSKKSDLSHVHNIIFFWCQHSEKNALP